MVQHSLSQVPGWAPNQPQVQQIIQVILSDSTGLICFILNCIQVCSFCTNGICW